MVFYSRTSPFSPRVETPGPFRARSRFRFPSSPDVRIDFRFFKSFSYPEIYSGSFPHHAFSFFLLAVQEGRKDRFFFGFIRRAFEPSVAFPFGQDFISFSISRTLRPPIFPLSSWNPLTPPQIPFKDLTPRLLSFPFSFQSPATPTQSSVFPVFRRHSIGITPHDGLSNKAKPGFPRSPSLSTPLTSPHEACRQSSTRLPSVKTVIGECVVEVLLSSFLSPPQRTLFCPGRRHFAAH